MFLLDVFILGFLLPQVFTLDMASFSQTDTSNATCPIPWFDATFVDMGCLLFNGTEYFSWEEANIYCQTMHNATLLELTTIEQLEIVKMELEVIAASAGSRDWWTSGTDVGQDGKWFWASSLEMVANFTWGPGQPSPTTMWNCLYLENSLHFMGTNVACSEELYPICQRKIQ